MARLVADDDFSHLADLHTLGDEPLPPIVLEFAAGAHTYLCHTGQKLYDDTGSAQSCGRLTAKYATFFRNENSLGKIDPCQTLGGDSGGPVWNVAGEAFGFHKGGGSGDCYFSWASLTEEHSGWRPWVSGGK